MKPDIRKFSEGQLQEQMLALGEKSFRSKQVWQWLWQRSAASFDDMTNLSLELRDKMKESFIINALEVDKKQISSDKTIKNAFKLYDGNIIEGVLIPSGKRMTACVSSQVGCSLSCKFCATGKLDRVRNLDAGEIVDQVVHLNKQAEIHYNRSLTNIVYMGMGEPLLNYKEMLRSTALICSPDGLGMSPKRITVSTAGIAKMIKKLADDEVKFNLALSLHAANDAKRLEIMPINDQNNLNVLREALIYFHEKTGTRITYEYIVLQNFNDSLEDAAELAEFCKITPCKINLIEYNSIDGGQFKKSSDDQTQQFADFLERKNLIVNIRRSRGKDIDAACGQLANKSNC